MAAVATCHRAAVRGAALELQQLGGVLMHCRARPCGEAFIFRHVNREQLSRAGQKSTGMSVRKT